MNKRSLWLILIALLLTGAGLWYASRDSGGRLPDLPPFSLEDRPLEGRYLFDYAGILGHYREGAEKYLDRLALRFGIEAMVVTLPGTGQNDSIETLAADLVNGWEIGEEYQGRGLLLLLSQEGQEVKLEVSYELEDVFTDAFAGYIEDLQLKPYFLSGDIGIGLIAVMEEIERRAQIKNEGNYADGLIVRLDAQLLSGGAGAKRTLSQYREDPSESRAADPAEAAGAATAEEAWQIMLSKWSGRGEGIDKNIYTELTRMAMGDPDRPEARTRAAVKDWAGAAYEVLQGADHAVIWFGNREGWTNAPFLFCRTEEGWKFDIVYQRRLVVMTENPHWKIEQGDYPYVSLLAGAKQSTGKDIPLSPEDIYSCDQDASIAQQMVSLEKQLGNESADFATVMQLARLNVLTGRRPKHVTPLLNKAKRLNPASAEPYRYSAIYHVNAFFQYETALEETAELLQRSWQDLHGLSMQGFLHYRLGNYKLSLDSLEPVIGTEPGNVYALALMARDYTLLFKNAKAIDPRKNGYRESAIEMLRRAENAPVKNTQRTGRLRAWMQAWGAL